MCLEEKDPGFSEVESIDCIQSIATLETNQSQIKIWTKNSKAIAGIVLSVAVADKSIEIKLRFVDETINLNNWLNEHELLINFKVKGIKFFSKADGIAIYKDNILGVRLASQMYKIEKRKFERVTVFPDHSSYLFYKISQNDEIISFNQKEVFKRLGNELFFPHSDSRSVRILDISTNGISFLINNEDKSKFENIAAEKISVYLLISNELVMVHDTEIAYIKDAKDFSSENDQKFRVAIHFEVNQDIEEILDNNVVNNNSYDQGAERKFEFILNLSKDSEE